eukprot:2570822-Pyramimonas_sp.AAC.1
MGIAVARARLGQPPLRDREGQPCTPAPRRGIGARAAGASAERAARQPAARATARRPAWDLRART